ncbi:NADP-dependent oxidoreductase [Amycolatopsis sp. GM8]|uniref:NADP-dependent oxidoreductase n=1 Tax=Amycolatopsis sp. GM8 TaxID=2896530 RepID=UPI001F2B3EA1|nr:NADP-dependent oxidoreductase [Amycolatopsis sp. GM8]
MSEGATKPYARFVLARHPVGLPVPEDFRLEHGEVPEPGAGQVVVEHTHLGLAPAARVRMTPALPGEAVKLNLGETVYGAASGRVIASKNPEFPVGTHVASVDGGWQTHAISDGANLTAIDLDLAPASVWMGLLGISGFTGYVGLEEIGRPRPGETLVVSAAGGAVGSFVVQMARLRGARVVGVAGGPEKCRFVEQKLGAAACVDHRSASFAEQLADACAGGVDVYFDNVGGRVRDAVWPHLNEFGRVVVCGQVSQYSLTEPEPGPGWYEIMLKRLLVQGLFWRTHLDRMADFHREVGGWVKSGEVVALEDFVDGLESCPAAFTAMLEGRYTGKVVVRL